MSTENIPGQTFSGSRPNDELSETKSKTVERKKRKTNTITSYASQSPGPSPASTHSLLSYPGFNNANNNGNSIHQNLDATPNTFSSVFSNVMVKEAALESSKVGFENEEDETDEDDNDDDNNGPASCKKPKNISNIEKRRIKKLVTTKEYVQKINTQWNKQF